jgi:L-ascorbate metabolism protein UlaG (beta-lactamase superfamily)
MVSMDAAQGVRLMKMVEPGVTIPIHYDDYEVFASGVAEFEGEVGREKVDGGGVVILERREAFEFRVRGEVGRRREEEAYFGGGWSSP